MTSKTSTSPLWLMSPPRRDWQLKGKANFRSEQAGHVDASLARREWCSLADAIVECGADVLVCPPHPEQALTGMIYTAEAGELYHDDQGHARFILPNMASTHRQLESEWIGPFMQSMGTPTERIHPTWEAQGDAIRVGGPDYIVHTYGIGPYARTRVDAYEVIADKLSAEHIQIEFVADPWFHGNTFMNVYHHGDDSLLMICPEALAPNQYAKLTEALGDVPRHEITRGQSMDYDTNALQVCDTVLASATLSKASRSALEALGLNIRELALDELFLKGGGAPVCLSNRLWGWGPSDVPKKHLWSAHPDLAHHEALGRELWTGLTKG